MNKTGLLFIRRLANGMRTLTGTRAAELLAVALLSAGSACAVFSRLNFLCAPAHAVLLAVLATFLVWLVTRRWWVLPALAAGAGVGFGLLRLVMLHPAAHTALSSLYRHAAAYSAAHNLVYLLVFCLGCCAGLFWFVRRAQLLPLALAGLGIVCLGVVVWAHIVPLSLRTPVLALLCAGFLTLLPGIHFRRMKQEAASQNTVTLTALQLTALPIALISVAAALMLVPQDAGAWRSRTLLNIVYDVGDLIGYWFGGSAPSRSFELETLGYQPLSDRLGGPIHPSETQVLHVTSNYPVLLRGAVQDTYSGRGWYDSGTLGRFRFDSLMFRGTRSRVLGSELPLMKNGHLKEYAADLTRDIEVEVQYRHSRNTGIFTAGYTENLRFNKKLDSYFNAQGELFCDSAIPVYTNYTLTARVLDRSLPGFDEKITALQSDAARYGDDYWQEVRSRYLTLPADLPDRVTALARSLTEQADSPYKKARAIEQWLATHCTYTLTPAVPPPKEDFVAHFLDTGEGYCVYYASAMAVLARCAGLPARYVTGFALERTQTQRFYHATNQTAHAWAEVYLYGIGWVTFDPLGFGGGLEPAAREAQPSQTAPESPASEPYVPTLPSMQPADSANTSAIQATRRVGLWVLALLAAAGMLLVLARVLLMLPARRYRRADLLARCGGSASATLCDYYADVLRQLEFFELAPYLGETLREFSPRVDRRLFVRGHRFVQATAAYMDLLYGHKPPGMQTLEEMEALHADMEQRLLLRMGKPLYLMRRVLQVLADCLLRPRG